MALLDPVERSARGADVRFRLLNGAPTPTGTLYEQSWRDFVFAEVWDRPGLATRARFLIAIAGSADVGEQYMLDRYVEGALASRELSVSELREAALHVAVYSGWSVGARIDRATTTACAALGLVDQPSPLIRADAWDPAQRITDGVANFAKVMTFGGPPPQTAYFEAGIVNFVFGEMWTRPGLDEVSRRWLTLVGVADSASDNPIRSHVYAAMKSGNATRDEMLEFVLQYAIHAGWPKASVVQIAVLQQAERVANGLPFEP
ncbi:MAG TPA: carboxymuconolactone decarboxylase family protein [Sphingobium sp.]|uniref:carboxymuconolactone decarboxylase family protein n=1 Tax=Sphingobium sp. TaxID=1912891 RepID=UPI002ED0EF69